MITSDEIKNVVYLLSLLVASALLEDPLVKFVTTYLPFSPFWIGMGIIVIVAFFWNIDK